MDKQDDRRTLQDILSVYRTLGMMHAASEMTRATQHLNYAGVSYDILPIKDGLEFLLEGMLGSLNLRPSKIKEIADSIETHFNESRPEGVLAMMEFHDRASNVYFEEARLRSYQLEKPERGDCADEDEYNDRLEDWKLEHKVWMDLKNLGEAALHIRDLIAILFNLHVLRIPPRRQESMRLPTLTEAQRRYLVAFTSLATEELDLLRVNANEILCTTPFSDRISPTILEVSERLLTRRFRSNGKVTKSAFYNRIAERAGGSGSEGPPTGAAVRQALTTRFDFDYSPVVIGQTDPLEEIAAKLLFTALVVVSTTLGMSDQLRTDPAPPARPDADDEQ